MKKIILIRHAESEANLGDKILPHDNIIKITENGKKQAEDLREILDKPDRIIVSKFIRTLETAEPTINKFPDSEVHLWLDTHEFNHMSNMTTSLLTEVKEYKELHDRYWERLDPNEKNGEGESFKEFIDRVNGVILKFKKIPDGVNYFFTHAYFIKMFYLLCEKYSDFNGREKTTDLYSEIMKDFVIKKSEFKVANTQVLDVTELVEKYSE